MKPWRWYPIVPVSAPRQSRRDAYDPSPHVQRYRAFRDDVALRGVHIPQPFAHLVFLVPMPESWSKKKCREHVLQPHQSKPDFDNLGKALVDAVYREGDDAHVHDARITKRWAPVGLAGVLVSSSTLDVTVSGLGALVYELTKTIKG